MAPLCLLGFLGFSIFWGFGVFLWGFASFLGAFLLLLGLCFFFGALLLLGFSFFLLGFWAFLLFWGAFLLLLGLLSFGSFPFWAFSFWGFLLFRAFSFCLSACPWPLTPAGPHPPAPRALYPRAAPVPPPPNCTLPQGHGFGGFFPGVGAPCAPRKPPICLSVCVSVPRGAESGASEPVGNLIPSARSLVTCRDLVI